MIIYDPKNGSNRKNKYYEAINSVRDEKLRDFIITLWDSIWSGSLANQNINTFNSMVDFCAELKDKRCEEITWRVVCDLAHKKETFSFICMHLTHYLLKNDYYHNEYELELKALASVFDIGNRGTHREFYKELFAYDDVKYLFYAPNDSRRKLYKIKCDNAFVKKVVIEFCLDSFYSTNNEKNIVGRDWFNENVGMILGVHEQGLHSIGDFNYAVLKTMLDNSRIAPNAAAVYKRIFMFFMFLINHPSGEGKNILKETDPIPVQALNRQTLALDIIEGHEYHFYDPQLHIPDGDKWILDINGYDKANASAKASETLLFDFTNIKSSFYRQCVKEYIWHDEDNGLRSKRTKLQLLCSLMNALTDIKSNSVHQKEIIKAEEMAELEDWIREKYSSSGTRIKLRTSMRRFLSYADEKGLLSVEPEADKQLTEFVGRPVGKYYKLIPEEDLSKLQDVMHKHACESPQRFYCYTVLVLLTLNMYSASELCHLQISKLMEDGRQTGYVIKTSKNYDLASYGELLNETSKPLFDEAFSLSEQFRTECSIDSIKKYLFLYKSLNGRYTPLQTARFNFYLKQCCTEAGIKAYTSSELRGAAFKYKI